MRSFSFAALLLAVLLGLNIFCYNFIRTSVSDIDESIDKIILHADKKDYKKANKEFELLKSKAEESKKIWFIIINHQEIDNVDISMRQSEAYLKKEAESDLIASLNTLKYNVNNVYEREKVNIINIF